MQPKGAELYTIKGLPPDLSKPLPGCSFAARCEFATDDCRNGDAPALKEIKDGHRQSCLRVKAGEI
jgi:oligopeptide transport system ATP-binding protein